MSAHCMHVQVWACVQGMGEEMVLGGKADLGSLQGGGIPVLKMCQCSGVGSWWDIMLFLAEAKIKTQ